MITFPPKPLPRIRSYCLVAATGALVGSLLGTSALAAPPAGIAGKYKANVDTSISDEFNAGSTKKDINFARWSYRKDPSANSKNVRGGLGYVFRKNNVLHCIGNFKQKNAGGIVSKKAKKYGFYETKWRSEGFKLGKVSPFHPSIWMAETDQRGRNITRGPGGDWLEIDFIEFEVGKLRWSSDAPPFVNNKKRKAFGERAIMVDKTTTGVVNAWNVHGLEYTPDFLQVWRKTNGSWKKIGRKVNFKSGDTFNENTVPKSARTAGFWYIGNLWLTEFGPGDRSETQNTKFMCDYFRFYPRK